MALGRKTGGRQVEGDSWRFWAKVRIRPGCWLYTGYIDKKGYGRFSVRPDGGGEYDSTLAHDFAYEQLIGPIPEGKVLDHAECDNPSCPNPFHVAPTTNRLNVLRGKGPSAINSRKTHCIRGHPFDAENTYIRKSSPYGFRGRRCRICDKARLQKRSKRVS